MEITKQGQEESAAFSSSNTWHKVESLISVEGTNMAINSWVYLAFWGYDSKSTKVNYYFNRLWNSCFAWAHIPKIKRSLWKEKTFKKICKLFCYQGFRELSENMWCCECPGKRKIIILLWLENGALFPRLFQCLCASGWTEACCWSLPAPWRCTWLFYRKTKMVTRWELRRPLVLATLYS